MKEWTEIPDISLYSDGGAEPNPGIGGFGVILSYKGKEKEFYQGYKLTTNNRMELMGVIYGLEQLKTKSNVQVFTDSQYVVNGINKGWAEKWKQNNWIRKKSGKALNSDLWDRLLTLTSEHNCVFNWVKGHAGHIQNERCDVLANQGIYSADLLDDHGYEPPVENEESPAFVTERQHSNTKTTVEKEGDRCRKCDAQVIKRTPKKKTLRPNQTYYFEYYLFCPSCQTMYMVEDAKREITGGSGLFS
jgi:ribonuclease HI